MRYRFVIKGLTSEDFSEKFSSDYLDTENVAKEIAMDYIQKNNLMPDKFEEMQISLVLESQKGSDQPEVFNVTPIAAVDFFVQEV